MAGPETLSELFAVIEARKGAPPDESYTANLYSKGLEKIAQKLGEEATEAVIAAVARDGKALAAESADLLYHLLVLWAAKGVRPEDVYADLARRTGQSGIAEKRRRSRS